MVAPRGSEIDWGATIACLGSLVFVAVMALGVVLLARWAYGRVRADEIARQQAEAWRQAEQVRYQAEAAQHDLATAGSVGSAHATSPPVFLAVEETVPKGERGATQAVTTYYLNREAALHVVMRLRTPRAVELQVAIVRVFLRAIEGPPMPPALVPRPINRPPTKKQTEILEYIKAYAKTFGAPPTYREIGAHFDIGSTNAVNDHLRALARKGLIVHREGKARGILLPPEPAPPPAPPAPPVSSPEARLDRMERLVEQLVVAVTTRPLADVLGFPRAASTRCRSRRPPAREVAMRRRALFLLAAALVAACSSVVDPPDTSSSSSSSSGSGGDVTCQPGWTRCSFGGSDPGVCTDTSANPEYCGSCDYACALDHAIDGCDAGTCVVLGCQEDGNCDGVDANGCETDTLSDAQNCGSCGIDCGEAAYCNNGACLPVP